MLNVLKNLPIFQVVSQNCWHRLGDMVFVHFNIANLIELKESPGIVILLHFIKSMEGGFVLQILEKWMDFPVTMLYQCVFYVEFNTILHFCLLFLSDVARLIKSAVDKVVNLFHIKSRESMSVQGGLHSLLISGVFRNYVEH